MGPRTLLGGLWMLGGVDEAGGEAGVAMTRTTLVVEAALTATQGVAQVPLLLCINPLCTSVLLSVNSSLATCGPQCCLL